MPAGKVEGKERDVVDASEEEDGVEWLSFYGDQLCKSDPVTL
jgi:hypothetical protein